MTKYDFISHNMDRRKLSFPQLTDSFMLLFFFFSGANELFSFDDKEIVSKLPVVPGDTTDITVTITGTPHIPQGIESNEKLSYDPEAPWGLTGAIHFRYASGVTGSKMCRKATMAIDVSVVPSLLCENFQIIELPRYFYLFWV